MSSKVFLPPLARLLMSSLFVWDGIVQLRNPGGPAQYFATLHVPAPAVAVWISIAVHLLGGLALLAGFYSRWAAVLLALVCLGTALGVHLPAGDPDNMIHFYKNLVMTGGFLYVIAFGPGALSLDRASVPAEPHPAPPAAPFRPGASP
jgi:putative oxidoreductase